MVAVAHSVSLKSISTLRFGQGGTGSAAALLGDEWNGFALDFLSNSFATRTATSAERLLSGTATMSQVEPGLGLDFTDNNYAVGV